jgi:DNA polymerase-3 subunit gamma/tau
VPAPEPPPPAAPEPEPSIPGAPPKSSRTKTTFNMNGLFKPAETVNGKSADVEVKTINHTVKFEALKHAWFEYAEKRKGQVAEYQILQRDFIFNHPVVSITLTNPVEETLLDNFRRDLTQFLRERLQNAELSVESAIVETTGKKVIYTSKEKFEHLAEKNPYLHELKTRLGLDWDY